MKLIARPINILTLPVRGLLAVIRSLRLAAHPASTVNVTRPIVESDSIGATTQPISVTAVANRSDEPIRSVNRSTVGYRPASATTQPAMKNHPVSATAVVNRSDEPIDPINIVTQPISATTRPLTSKLFRLAKSGLLLSLVIGLLGSLAILQPTSAYAGTVKEAQLEKTSCHSSGLCATIGYWTDNNGKDHLLASSYDGISWRMASLPDPVGSQSSNLNSISCGSTSCVAVGSWRDNNWAMHLLAYSYDGNSWSLASLPEPVGAQGSHLDSISCGSTSCVAVGSWADNSTWHLLAYSYDGNSWSLASLTEPVGAQEPQLNSTSCSSTSCTAVGQWYDGNNYHSLAYSYDGNSWSLASLTEPVGAAGSMLQSIGCNSTSCVAVGYWYDNNWAVHPLNYNYDGNSWSLASLPEPVGAVAAMLNSISCSSTSCVAVGYWYDGNNYHSLAYSYDGNSWSLASLPEPVGAVAAMLNSISCSSTSCVAVGQWRDNNSIYHPLAYSYDGSSWSQLATISAPTNLAASNITDTSLDLDWQAPGSLLPIQHYIVQYKPSTASQWSSTPTPNDSTHWQLTGLLRFTSYDIRIVAVDQQDQTSPPSTSINIITPAIPNAGSYDIHNCAELQAMNDHPVGAVFNLAEDIDCSDTVNWHGGSGFEPIGADTPFVGRLNGNGHSIIGLFANNPTDNGRGNAGLFDTIQQSIISNLTLINPNLTASNAIGSLASFAQDSAIANVQVTGGNLVLSSAGSCAGGLIGNVVGSAITQSSFEGLVGAQTNCAGGLFGQLVNGQNLSSLDDSFANAQMIITSPSGGSFGGLAGNSSAVITNSYAAGELTITSTGASAAGGLVGLNSNDGQASIRRSFGYLTIDITNAPNTTVGGLVGVNAPDPNDPNDRPVASVLDATDYFDATRIGTNRCTGNGGNDCAAKNTLAGWAPLANLPEPVGAQEPQLNSTSCSSTSCTAVGQWRDNNSIYHPLAYSYDGSSWSLASLPEPVGAQGSRLSSISCSSTSCTAVGQWYDGNNYHSLAYSYDGSNWSLASLTEPVGTRYSYLLSTSCSSTSCTAVGQWRDNNSIYHPLAYSYNGSNWNLASVTEPVGAAGSMLNSISCSSTSCTAVGQWYDNNSIYHPLAYSYDGVSWSLASLTEPVGAQESMLNSTSCSSTSCTAVGQWRDNNSIYHPLAYSYNGSNWNLASVTEPVGAAGSMLNSISCSSTSCVVIGHWYDGNDMPHPLNYNYDGSSWSLASLPEPVGAVAAMLQSIGCNSTSCVSVGYWYDNNDMPHPLNYNYDGSSWSLANLTEPVGAAGSMLNSISCSSTSCTAVGQWYDNNSNSRPLIMQPAPGVPAPGYFLANHSNPPLLSWDFGSIWQTTAGLPSFIAGRIVTPILPLANPLYHPAPSPSPVAPPRPTPPSAAVVSSTPLPGGLAKTSLSPTTPAADTPTDNPVIAAIKKLLKAIPPEVLVSFPYVLFGSLLLMSGAMFIEMIRQGRRLQAIHRLLLAQRNIAQARDTFWHLAANYLRAPITLLMGGVDLLNSNPPVAKSVGAAVASRATIGYDSATSAIIANITKLATSMQTKVAKIMEQIEQSDTLKGITWPKQSSAQRIGRSLRFWVPLLVVASLIVLANWVARDYRQIAISNFALASQAVMFVIIAIVLYWAMELLGRAKRKRDQAEVMLERQTTALDSARYSLIASTAGALDQDVDRLVALIPKLPNSTAVQSSAPLLYEGTRRLRQIVDSFHLLITAQDRKLAELSPAGSSASLRTALADCVAELKPALNAKNIVLSLPSNDDFTVPGDVKLLTQIISSTLANAIAFSPKGSSIGITARQNAESTKLIITDHGAGIAADQLEHVFQPFTKADGQDALQMDHEGLGVNLYLDREIMQYLGGDIGLKSTAGKGTTVTMTWPRV